MRSTIKRLTEVETKKADKGSNGFYIQAEHWGTCFHRVSKTRQEIDMTYNQQPTCFHTYTKIPERIAHNVFDVYVNYYKTQTPVLFLPFAAKVIGFDQAQPSGDYMNRSFLIYCPSGQEPTVGLSDLLFDEETFLIETQKGELIEFNLEFMFRGRKIQKIFLDQEGYQLDRKKDSDILIHSDETETTTLGDILNEETPRRRRSGRNQQRR